MGQSHRGIWLLLLLFFHWSLVAQEGPLVGFKLVDSAQRLDITVDGNLLASYQFRTAFYKPVLWPVMSPAGNMLTRSYPFRAKVGDRVDHPHHIGVWMNYGNINGFDFWNNSPSVPSDKKDGYGNIVHDSIEVARTGKGKGVLATSASWNNHRGKTLLRERTVYEFTASDGCFIIDRTTQLTALSGPVAFEDNKEGFFAIRVARELELSHEGPVKVMGADGKIIEELNPSVTTGQYHSASGLEGNAVWGTRAKWMMLQGFINNIPETIIIFDHPSNIGYPTYWHARGYGLFSANPLGQKIFSKGNEALNFELAAEDSVTFKYRLVLTSGEITDEQIDELSDQFAKKQNTL